MKQFLDDAGAYSSRGWNDHLKRTNRRKRYATLKHKKRFGEACRNDPNRRMESEKVLDYLELMVPNYKEKAKPRRKVEIKLPETFCFIYEPEVAMKTIVRVIKNCRDEYVKNLVLNHRPIKAYSLTSDILLALGVGKAKQMHRRGRKSKKHINGYYPDDPDHEQLIREIGVVKEINGKSQRKLPFEREKQHLFSKKSVNFNKANAYSEDDHSRAAEAFVKHVNECVYDFECSLDEEAEIELLKCVGEVLDNAQRHSSLQENDHMWFIRGYLNNHTDSKDFELSIFNFGRTIAESFEDLPEDHFSLNLVNSYAEEHMFKNFTREQLITVAAMQQRYSSRNDDIRGTNGQGTILLIEFFEKMYEAFHKLQGEEELQNNQRMSIVSGKTHILFDGKYKLKDLQENSDDEQMIIAFNHKNTLELPPDPNNVKHLKDSFFPGVAISIRFPLKKRG